MEQLNIILSIIASTLSIAAAIIALVTRSEVKKLNDSYGSNKQVARGNNNVQSIGHDNGAKHDD